MMARRGFGMLKAARKSGVLRGIFRRYVALPFTADGQKVVTGSYDNTARLWDANSGEQEQIFSGLSAAISSAVFSPNGQFILTGSGSFNFADANVAHLWDLQTGAETRRLLGHGRKSIP